MHILFRFGKNQRGSVAIIVALLFVPMLLALGAGIDFARYEIYRVQLQSALDRGVLAAASLSQSVPTRQTIEEFVAVNTVGIASEIEVTETSVTNAKIVSASLTHVMPTAFLKMIGIEEMPIIVSASAEERRQNIEISLILDLSGSMRFNNKIGAMRPAAIEFINTILTETTRDYTSVSIVPYAGQVGVGAAVFDGLDGFRTHNHSSCFEFAAADYASGRPNFQGRAQVPHFTHWNNNSYDPGLNPGWCPSDNTAITALSNEPVYLRNQISGYQMYDGTGTHIAINWGLMLLDPSMRPLIAEGAASGMINPRFSDRPAAFDDLGTRKFIVLMTDGEISAQFRPNDPNRNIRSQPNNRTTENGTTTLNRMYQVCNAAKAQGVVVFTIAFQVAAGNRAEMRNCASTENHFYEVNDLDIRSAFESIATAIQHLKLTG